MLFAVTLLWGCTADLCGNDPLTHAESPDKKHLAVIFVRDCGATTGYSTQVSIWRQPAELLNESGNIAVVDGKTSSASVRWDGNDRLVISGMGSDKRFLRVAEYQGIKIEYE